MSSDSEVDYNPHCTKTGGKENAHVVGKFSHTHVHAYALCKYLCLYMYAESDVSSGVDSSPTHFICANTKGNDCGLGKISGSCVHSCFQEVVYHYNDYTDV